MRDIGLIAAVAGLFLLLSFTQTARRLLMNKLSTALSVVSIPMFIAAMWRIAIDIGWWAAAMFVLASMLAGIVNGVMSRLGGGTVVVYQMQPLVGGLAAACIGISWATLML